MLEYFGHFSSKKRGLFLIKFMAFLAFRSVFTNIHDDQ